MEDFAALVSAQPHDFRSTKAVSFVVNWKNQVEVDCYWADQATEAMLTMKELDNAGLEKAAALG